MGVITQDLSLCLQLLVQSEENLLCAMSTHSDLQQLPYIWALMLLCLAGFSTVLVCSHTNLLVLEP